MTIAAPETSAVQSLNIRKEILIAASPDIVFETLLSPPGKMQEMNLKIEPFPGGRWFRDLGNNTGHLWGHVQVIKPPALLELVGPMFMSYAAASHIQYRLTPEGNSTRLTLTHTAVGLIPEEHLKNVQKGWGEMLEFIRTGAEQKAQK
jgi:uncharacterized protein YndB with AHSA1/START domain